MVKRFLIGASLAATLAVPAGAATIFNGSFEIPGTTGTVQTYNAGSGMLAGWRVDAGSVDLIGGLWQNSDGAYSLDMDGNAPGAISTLITDLTIGTKYRVSFDMAANTYDPTATKVLDVMVGGESGTFSFSAVGNSNASMGWQTMHIDFYASAMEETLAFISGSASGASGAALDNVRVAIAPVPLPAGGVLLLTGFGLMALRRKR